MDVRVLPVGVHESRPSKVVGTLLKGGDHGTSEGQFLLKLGWQRAALCNASSSLGQRSTELR
jgi:hypothetical protein